MRTNAAPFSERRQHLLCGVTAVFALAASASASLPALHVAGSRLVDPQGRPVVLRGCNLGNWLLLEPWMLALNDGQLRDQHDIVRLLERRFGPERARELLDVYRASWFGAREFALIKSFGFNVVRLPFHYGLLTSADGAQVLKPAAFEWLDRGIALAEDAGMYVILDLHGAPGGQSGDMTTGQIGQNNLWTDQRCQARTIWLWREIARRYRDNSTVVAYDLLNEPWGDYQADMSGPLTAMNDRLIAAIREIDADKLIFVAGTLRGIQFYGPPEERGWHNVGITEHCYPGLHGNGTPTLETHRHYLEDVVPARCALLRTWDTPYLLGEFNVVHDFCAQAELMREYYDRFAECGWAATMWSARRIVPEGGISPGRWSLLANAEPFALPDLHTASDGQIEAAFRSLATQPVAVDEALRAALTQDASDAPAVFAQSVGTVSPAPAICPVDWQIVDVRAHSDTVAIPAGEAAATWSICGVGNDIWDHEDTFRFVYRDVAGDFRHTVWLTQFDASLYAKAGWMIRASTRPDAAHAFVHAFSDGRVLMAWRGADGGMTKERVLGTMGFPVGLGIERVGDRLVALYADAEADWHQVRFDGAISLPDAVHVGLAVNSRDDVAAACARFARLDNDAAPTVQCGPNCLTNGSFEDVADSAADQARGWSRWGDWINRETGWEPTRDGTCLIGYHHWQIPSADNSGMYQDVSGLMPGRCYEFRVYASRDVCRPGRHGAQDVELRLESFGPAGLLRCASRSYPVQDLASDGHWSRLSVSAIAPSGELRVLIIVNPSREEPRGAAVKFDAAVLAEMQDE